MVINGPFCRLSSLSANVSLDDIHCCIYCLPYYILACGSLFLSHFFCVAALSYYRCHGAFFSSSSFFSLWLDRNLCQSFCKRIKMLTLDHSCKTRSPGNDNLPVQQIRKYRTLQQHQMFLPSPLQGKVEEVDVFG